ncbi:hypothetical protein [Priestia flexa]|nr:hypothetical protein [Priestia flexa]
MKLYYAPSWDRFIGLYREDKGVPKNKTKYTIGLWFIDIKF